MELQLQGRTALVTGAAGGIGRAVAQALAAEGVRVALLDRSAAGLEDTAALCAGSVPLVADVTDEQEVAEAVAAAVGTLGALHIVVCCAGISGPVGSGVEQTSLADWQRVFAVNVTGAFLVVRAALPALRAAPDAAVVLVASDSAFVASPGMAAYCASKAALVQFGRALSVDLAGDDVRVTSVSPSVVDTPMSRGDLGDDAFSAPDFPVQSAEEVAAHVVYLASPRARAVNGSGILSDFGYSARSGFPA
ncbi:SDR family NAD(P)-dependent oxidoreductase [Microbacterium azadirachtae]|uniref:SDR family NAD(P)-dependent oxidoreductase n=1 Tax=Microbacterium azadirachtae TaxID=582680 RepID=UPI0008835F9D|nr:SDR family oxidoreductase [Microbacterium azadirachtae]SDM35084.1 NADP-dependent 3-hydroxy acid dehydrogenase YdfG [Microbacterium azadirachtae]SEG52445.1 NADP-dependent 3-hydroxy acid dehydrogenase YdfG [Microbacterium azadirachtae]SEG55493.1 NADP-dependent 3-hydroxy acid dehydrogenase YdfG [Microbacterium azadirachtae]